MTEAPVATTRWLLGLVAASTVVRASLALSHGCPFVFDDEVIYADMARGLADTGTFTVRDVPSAQTSVVYSALIAPIYAWIDALPVAWSVVKVFNALLLSLAAIPIYHLARRLLEPVASLFVAALSLAVPSMVFAATVMTENAFYPIAACFTLALVRAVERPGVARQLIVVALLALAVFTRAQAIVFGAATVTAYVGWAWRERHGTDGRGFWRGLAPFWPTWSLLAIGIGGLVAIAVDRGGDALLGAYASQKLFVPQARRLVDIVVNHIAVLDLSTGIVPLAAFVVLAALGLFARDATRSERVVAVVGVSVVGWVTLFAAAWIAVAGGHFRILERAIFPVSPLLFVALGWWTHRADRPRAFVVVAAIAAVAAAALPAAITGGSIGHSGDSPVLYVVQTLQEDAGDAWPRWAAVILVGFAVVALALLTVRRISRYAPAVVLLAFIPVLVAVERRVSGIAGGVAYYTVGAARDWVDRAVPGDATVAVLWNATLRRETVWVNEFFNRRVGPVYATGGSFSGWPVHTRVEPDADGRFVAVEAGREPIAAGYVIAHETPALDGEVIARMPNSGFVLIRTNGFLQLAR